MAIKKGRIVFEFMYDDTVLSDAEVAGLSIDEIVMEADGGFMIGYPQPLEVTTVAPEDVKPLLLEWKNDGTFFDED